MRHSQHAVDSRNCQNKIRASRSMEKLDSSAASTWIFLKAFLESLPKGNFPSAYMVKTYFAAWKEKLFHLWI